MLDWMKNWCRNTPCNNSCSFPHQCSITSYGFGVQTRETEIYSQIGPYDFTVSPLALKEFEKKYGYALTSEDFINKGELHATHMTCDKKKLDWMEFINDFVVDFR